MTQAAADPRFAPPDDASMRRLVAVADIVGAFRELSPSFPASYMLAFLDVAMRPGGGSTDYMATLETVQPVMSRILVALGPKSRAGEDGFGLIETALDVRDLRRRRSFLTPKGKGLLKRITRAVERANAS